MNLFKMAEHDKKIRDQARKETLAEQRTRTKTRGGQRTIEWSE